MKVFISWSGEISCNIAKVLKEWIPCVIQSVEPYFSSEDIDKGSRWSTDIAKELEVASFGIICITNENLQAPWLNFEAGALSKALDKSRLCPFLFNVKPTEVKGPLVQFQMTTFTKEDLLKLLLSINKSCENESLPEERLKNIFDVFWPKLELAIDEIRNSLDDKLTQPEEKVTNENSAVIEEILDIVRNQQRLLRSPEELIPSAYLREVIRDVNFDSGIASEHPVFKDLEIAFLELKENLMKGINSEQLDSSAIKLLINLEDIINYITKRSTRRIARRIG